jgi:hypothetical protein
MTFQAILIIAVVGATSVLIAVGRAISAAQFGRSLRAAHVEVPARSPAEPILITSATSAEDH